MVVSVAGHEFDEFGRCLLKQTNTDLPCPIKWRDIAHVDATFANMPGYAHYMRLNASECQQIMDMAAKERERCEKATAAAVGTPIYEEEKTDAVEF